MSRAGAPMLEGDIEPGRRLICVGPPLASWCAMPLRYPAACVPGSRLGSNLRQLFARPGTDRDACNKVRVSQALIDTAAYRGMKPCLQTLSKWPIEGFSR